MTMSRFPKCGCLAVAALLLLALLLNGIPSMLQAQTTSAPGEVPQQGNRSSQETAPSKDTATDKAQAPEERSSAYRNPKDTLKPFEPSEEIRVDKAVDFPADI